MISDDMTPSNQLKERWTNMKKQKNAFLLADGTHAAKINFGYRDFRKTLIIQGIEQLERCPKSSTSICVEHYPQGNSWDLSFSLLRTENEDLFMIFCRDIIESSRCVTENIGAFIAGRYLKWQKLLEAHPEPIMSVNAQKGLIGELLYLQSLIPEFGADKSIDSWAGPDGADHDFTYDDNWTEVKVIGFSKQQISISSLEQLDHPGVNSKLAVYFIEETTPSDLLGHSLSDIVAETRNLFKVVSPASVDFERKLCSSGYSDTEPAYSRQKFLIGAYKLYQISEKFPKITRSEVHHAVTCAKYSLSLAAIDDFQIEEE